MNEIEKGQLASMTVQCLSEGSGALSQFPGLLKKVIVEQVWTHRIYRGKEFRLSNLRELITSPPPEGWGEDPTKIEAVIKDDPVVLPLFREAMKGVNQHDLPNDNVMEQAATQGNSRAYTLERLKKQHPAIYEEVKDGKLSANAGAIKAGFRKKLTPLERAQKAYDALTAADRAAFALWLSKQNNDLD